MQAVCYQSERAKQSTADNFHDHHEAAQNDHSPGLTLVRLVALAEENVTMRLSVVRPSVRSIGALI